MQKKKKSLIIAAALALTAGGAALTLAGSAQAAECPENMLCLYEDTRFGGHQMIITGDTPNVGKLFNDKTTAVRNNTDMQWCLFRENDYKGDLLVRVNAKQAIGNVGGLANDKTTSVASEKHESC